MVVLFFFSHQVICFDFYFGDQPCHFQATFSAQDRPQALAVAVAIASASADPQATIHVNGVMLYGNVVQMVPGGEDITMALPLIVPNTSLFLTINFHKDADLANVLNLKLGYNANK